MLDIVIPARTADITPGFSVKRILPYQLRRMVGPFIFVDHGGPVDMSTSAASTLDVLPHPHIGLSTVSYLFSGEVTHRDSLGVEQVIKPGEVNWMTAGKGIAHSERFEDPAIRAGGKLEMIQTWVALPEMDEEADPSFKNFTADQLPVFTDTGVWMRLIAGDAFGLKSEVPTNSPLFYLHVVLDQGSRFGIPTGYAERGVYIAKGSLTVNGINYTAGQLLVFSKGVDPVIVAAEHSTLMMLGGEHLGDRYIWWNFVSSRKERIEQAKEDWKQGRIILPPNDNEEFIPLPNINSRPAGGPPPNALS
ncbi:pirin family protein [Mucilaginibacter myungsuensis]|uniref:Pirin family protein n=1 Tax=Mucilaginibacter myungsuensis TaxID=649104 RepID=A0A929PX78_9SPHI|nr:pirin family protein [Mucilaginibacter myungsuensis]MBE9661942.1 pirin family protein [Mucilaginibacter myungsuensis]MDN3599625.1 pirin family protein [Mucilaginibacter myungsuensis]